MSLRCPVCHLSAPSKWGERNGFTLFRCNRCGHVFADINAAALEAMDGDRFRAEMTNGTMKSAEEYYSHLVKGEARGRHTWRTSQLILDAAGPPAGTRRWLDIGCGSAYLVGAAAGRGWDALGIEPGEWGQIGAREKQVRVIQGFLTDQTFPASEKFDVISAVDVIEHQSEPARILKLAGQYLAPSGRLFISLPTADSFHARVFRAAWEMIQPPTHRQFFSRRSFEVMLGSTGFALKSTIRFNQSSIPWLDHKAPAINRVAMRLLGRLGMGDQAIHLARPCAAFSTPPPSRIAPA
jgi:SAM-dependent methyltransferase